MRNGLWVVVLAVVACGAEPGGSGPGATQQVQQQPPDVAQPQVSGARLKAIWRVGADGSRLASGAFFDTVLGVKCTLSEVATDHTVGCAPVEYTVTRTSESFSDPGCTSPAATGPASTQFIRLTDGSVHGAVPAGSSLYAGTPAACVQYAVQNGMVLFNVGPDAQVVTFVDSPE